jgi:hypothetical protein
VTVPTKPDVHVRRFEDLARAQQDLPEAKRSKKKLARALASAIRSSNAAGDRALQKRIVTAARPLIRGSSLFAMRGTAWTVSVEGKVINLARCIDSCRAANPPGVQRELCEAACALWILFCGGSEVPEDL